MRRLVLAFVVLASGCDLYFTNGDDECRDYAELSIADNQLRNPQTGECQSFGYPCDSRCGPCPATDLALPDWGSCYSQCEGLAEGACKAEPGCFAAYLEFPTQDRNAEYRGCYQTAPSGPIDGSCANLDSQQCSRHDNCEAHYNANFARKDIAAPADFAFCAAESPTSCSSVGCPPNSTCEQHCDANGMCEPKCVPVDLCAAIDCAPGYECVQVCSESHGGFAGQCSASCVPNTQCEALTTENACQSRSDCVPVYKGEDCTCYPGYCECNILTWERCETK
jgi:hypothetical protein